MLFLGRLMLGHRWLALAVATLWVISVGGEADARLPVRSLEGLPDLHSARRRAMGRARPRLLSCFRRGVLTILAALLKGEPVPLGRFLPEPWPTEPPAVLILPPVEAKMPQKTADIQKWATRRGELAGPISAYTLQVAGARQV